MKIIKNVNLNGTATDITVENGKIASIGKTDKAGIDFGVPERDAVKMTTESPARIMKLNKGKIEVGYDADFIIVDNSFYFVRSIVRGES